MRMTPKQNLILTVLCDKNRDGSEVDLDQLIEELRGRGWETTKPSLQFSLRRLIGYALVEKKDREVRRGRRRAVLAVTDLGRRVMGKA